MQPEHVSGVMSEQRADQGSGECSSARRLSAAGTSGLDKDAGGTRGEREQREPDQNRQAFCEVRTPQRPGTAGEASNRRQLQRGFRLRPPTPTPMPSPSSSTAFCCYLQTPPPSHKGTARTPQTFLVPLFHHRPRALPACWSQRDRRNTALDLCAASLGRPPNRPALRCASSYPQCSPAPSHRPFVLLPLLLFFIVTRFCFLFVHTASSCPSRHPLAVAFP